MEGLKSVWIAVVALLVLGYATKTFGANYGDALYKSILFYEAQRSGRLPSSQRVNWRADSALYDGRQQGVDLVGGYYDAGDNVKFGLPMAFTITMLSWSALEYHTQLKSSGQLGYVLDAIKWGTDYFIKAHPEPNVLWGEVGDGYTDHTCWQRPEDMTTPRQAYKIDANSPGSDLAGETAAAMAAASIAFRKHNDRYSALLLNHAQQLFQFADTHRGKYDSSIQVAQKFYNSKSGYADELLWAAIWLFMATRNQYYLKYVADNAVALGGIGWNMKEFSWDVKYAGVQVLASKILMQGRGGEYTQTLQKYQYGAEYFLCACLQKNNGNNVQKTPGGLMYVRSWNNIQYVTSASFLLTVYSDYLTSAKQQLKCPSYRANPSELLSLAQQQINYILGDNPRATSYMVGYGAIFPQQVHHRASSIVSIKVNNQFVSCRGGYATWFSRRQRDPNILVGALVGGPDQNDNFADERDNYEQTEPATYNNGPLVGVLARLHVGPQRQDTPDSFTGTSFTSISQSPPPIHTGDLVEIKQNVTASWIQEESTYYRYAATVTNKSKQSLTQLQISINGLYGNLWGLAKIGNTNTYTFPQWRSSLSPGESLTFVYIQAAEEAEVLVAKAE